MYLRQIIICLFLMLIVMACSTTVDRTPSSELEPPLKFEDAFHIKHANDDSYKSGKVNLSYVLEKLQDDIRVDGKGSDFYIELIEAPIKDGYAFRIFPEIGEDGSYRIKVFAQKGIEIDDLAKAELISFLRGSFNFEKHVQTYYDFFEMSYNARLNDQQTLENFFKMKQVGTKKLDDYITDPDIKDRVFSDAQKQIDTVAPFLKKQKTERNKLEAKRKAVLASLDKVGENEQFRALVAAGKRKEAADLIDSYLPKEHMNPFEHAFWNDMLDIMRNPLPLEERILVYRGIDGDFVYPAIENGVELNKEAAIRESKVFMMSSMMTKNQGTWNRRLRSLHTMYDKFMGVHAATETAEFTQSARLTTFLNKHSLNPQGSPFLSYTPSPRTAYHFGKSQTAAYLIDPRALIANYASEYKTEREYLTTLVSFPDELVKVVNVLENEGDDDISYVKTKAYEAVVERIKAEKPDNFEDIVKEIYRKNEVMLEADNVNKVKSLEKEAPKSNKVVSFFKKLIGSSEVLETPPPVTDKLINKTPRNCNFLLQSLWMK